jgi:hypothetical protein
VAHVSSTASSVVDHVGIARDSKHCNHSLTDATS